MAFEDPWLPQVGNPTSKTSQTTTVINGSNAWGEELPPHFQFMTNAQTEEGKQTRNDCILYMHNVIGQFGLDANSFGLPSCHSTQKPHQRKENE